MSDWSVWIPIFTGLLAFFGAVAGHFVAFDLNAAAKRREVRRAQIERYAEFMSEDNTWMAHYKHETLFGQVNFQKETAPSDRAQAIFMLYFAPELSNTMKQFLVARREYEAALGMGYIARLQASEFTQGWPEQGCCAPRILSPKCVRSLWLDACARTSQLHPQKPGMPSILSA